MLRAALWAGLGAGALGSLAALGRFFGSRQDPGDPRHLRFGGGQLPRPGDPPLFVRKSKLYLVNLRRGEGGHGSLPGAGDAGIVALYQACTHLGCTLPWRPQFQFEGEQGWFRCPCHSATYTKAGVCVFGPAPRNMDYYDVSTNHDGSITVNREVLHRGQCRPSNCA